MEFKDRLVSAREIAEKEVTPYRPGYEWWIYLLGDVFFARQYDLSASVIDKIELKAHFGGDN